MPNPPRWADRLLHWLCAPHLLEEFLGDLHEAFHWRVQEKGLIKARWLFVFEVLRSIRFSHLKPTHYVRQYFTMYRNYLKTGWRFIKKHKLYSSLNILGLALGISFCWLAYLYAHDETSFDQHLPDHDRLYRIVIDMQVGDEMHYIGGSSNAMSLAFAEQIPEIEGIARINTDYGLIQKGKEVLEQGFLTADRELIDYLNLDFLEGAPGKFDQPNDVIISETLAGKLDLRGEAPGQILTVVRGNNEEKFIVRGVYKQIPENTSIQRDMIVSYTHYLTHAPERRLSQWMDINMNSLVKLKPQANVSEAERKMNDLHDDQKEDDAIASFTMKLQPISQIHLNEQYGHYNGIARGGNTELIRLFLIIGLFCLVISMINYSNFSISLYINRSREVALRKVIGAEGRGIFSQLITESFLSSFIAGLLALVVMITLLPIFSSFVQKNYDFSYVGDPNFLIVAIGILLATSLGSGIYPALVLSRFSIIKSLRGEQKVRAGKWITQTLLTVQFVIATLLVAGMITMRQQIRYLSTFDTKINYDDVIYIDYLPSDEGTLKAFVTSLSQMPEVAQVVGISGYNGTRMRGEYQEQEVRHLRIYQDMLSLLDIEVVQGRNFDPQISSDESQAVLINESLVKVLGFSDPIGETLPFKYGDFENPKIIGVVEDYHFESAKSTIEPLVIYQNAAYPLQSVYFKLASASDFDLAKFQTLWATHFDPFPFEYSFLEDVYQRQYRNEQRMMKLVAVGCFVSIFLAAIGLLGTVGIQLNQRLKEISIRKVLGATVGNLYQVFSGRFFVMIVVGLTGGLSVSYFVITRWLENYPFHVNFGFGLMSATLITTLSVALVTITSQVLKVAKSNPVKYLKDD